MTSFPRRKAAGAAAVLAACGLATVLAHGQAREWTTNGFDAQRTRWVRSDARLTQAAIESGEFRFLWKAVFENEARQLYALTEPVLQDLLIGYRGFKALAFVGGSADRLFSIDTDLGKPYWTTHLTYGVSTGGVPPSTWDCPGGLVAAPSRRTPLVPSTFGRGSGGRGGRAFSAVGEPGRGAAVLKRMASAAKAPAQAPPPSTSPPAGSRTIAAIPFGGVDPLYAMGSDGLLRTLRVSDGANMEPPVVFLPPSTYPSSLVVVDGFVYATTSNGCGAAPNALWVLDTLASDKKVARWETGGPNIVGSTGPTLGTDGTLYVALAPSPARGRPWLAASSSVVPANAIVALDRETLTVKDWFARPEAVFNAPPVVFRHGEREVIAIAAGDGRLFLLDGRSLGGSDHGTPLYVSESLGQSQDLGQSQQLGLSPTSGLSSPAGLATWADDTTRWILVPTGDRIVAFRLSGEGGSVAAERMWVSRPLVSPLAPLVVNRVVFVVSSGEFRGGDASMPAKERAERSSPAVLYALDGRTGKEMWSSGTTIGSFARAGISAGGGQVYVVTFDNTLYAFGIPMEH